MTVKPASSPALYMQGLKRVAPSNAMRAELLIAARMARDKLGEALVPPSLLSEVNKWLADYRSEHQRDTGAR